MRYGLQCISWDDPQFPALDQGIQADVMKLGAAAFTKSALDGRRSMGLISPEMLEVVASLSRPEFLQVDDDVFRCRPSSTYSDCWTSTPNC
jgi:hypothetical protein